MNREAFLGLFRHALTTAGGALASYGIIDEGQIETAAGAIMAMIGVVLSVLDKRAKA